MSRVTKKEGTSESDKLHLEIDKLSGISEFLTSPVYTNVISPHFKMWLGEAEVAMDKLSSTPAELKEAQIKTHYVKQLQRVLLNALNDYERKNAKYLELTGEHK